MQNRPKIPEMDYTRAIAIIAVLFIHGTSSAVSLPVGTGSQAVFFILNRASLFTVPVFIWISGVVLFYNYYDRWEPRASVAFWIKRLRRILIPYVLWSLFYYIYNQYMYHGEASFDPFYWFKLLLSGNASYHLYYMIIIIQFYLLFPIVMTAVRKFPLLRKSLIPLGLCVQAAAYVVNNWIYPLPHYTSLFVGYSALFAFGAFTGIYYEQVIAWADRRQKTVWAAMSAGGIGFVGMLLLDHFGLASVENTWIELALLLYSMAVALFIVQWGRSMHTNPSLLRTVMAGLGASSFGIYLTHPALLTLWRHISPGEEHLLLYDLYIVSSILVGLIGSWLLATLYRKIALTGKAIQKGKASAM